MLTPAERREKKLTKLVGEKKPDTLVAVYKVRHLLALPCTNMLCYSGITAQHNPARVSTVAASCLHSMEIAIDG